MSYKDFKVFIGPHEIANIGAILASALKEKGIKVTVVRTGMSPFSAGMTYDKVICFPVTVSKWPRWLRVIKVSGLLVYLLKLYYFLKFFPQHNVFIFLFGITLLPYNLDLPIIKLFNKKTIMIFVGSDIRHYENLETAAKNMGIKYYMSEDKLKRQQKTGRTGLHQKKRMIRMVEKHVDYIGAGQSYSQLLTRNYFTMYVPIDIDNIRYNNTPNEEPVVVHAPSNSGNKGTSYILKAVEQLREEGYDFKFYLYENTSNVLVRKALSNADISVDQLFGLAPGMFALESMAAGCTVLGSSMPEFAGMPPEVPTIHTDPDNIYQNLKMLLENPELRQELGEKGRKYVEKYHDHRKIADDFLQLITNK